MTVGYLRCGDYRCGWIGPEDEALSAPSPFDTEDTVIGCPQCREINNLHKCCDEPECRERATCGMPTPTGYRRTCGKHLPLPSV